MPDGKKVCARKFSEARGIYLSRNAQVTPKPKRHKRAIPAAKNVFFWGSSTVCVFYFGRLTVIQLGGKHDDTQHTQHRYFCLQIMTFSLAGTASPSRLTHDKIIVTKNMGK
jgi:hypothetical protein